MKGKTNMKNKNETKAARKTLRNKLEQGIAAKLGMTTRALEGKLSASDHTTMAKAARAASQLIRKSDPEKASALYYVFYKHTKLQGKPLDIPRLSRKAAPVKKTAKVAKAKTEPVVAPAAVPAEAVVA